jgi:hypothetical protein
MAKAIGKAVYNSRIANLGMPIPSQRNLLTNHLLLIALMLMGLPAAAATDWSGPERQLAAKIVAVTGTAASALEITNRSSLSHSSFDEINRGLRSQLESAGLRFVNADVAAVTVTISLSENLQNYVWIAEVRLGTANRSVVMVSTPRTGGVPIGHENAFITIHKALLWAQPEQILDVAVIDGSPTHMAILDTNRVSLYRLEGGHWQPEQIMPIRHTRPWPRDTRGRLSLRKDHLFDVNLPGIICRSTAKTPLALTCTESDDPWPLGSDGLTLGGFFTPSRNYFTGALAPGVGKQTSVTPFYSAAPLPRDKYTLWLFMGKDGQVHLLDGVTDQTIAKLDWGSDVASVHGACGANWNLLVTGAGDSTTDSLRAFDIPDREPIAISQPIEFPGPITALWTEANGNDAIAVSHNLETGDYEAFRLSFTCGQ